jgi:hypothetical protein
VRNHNHSKAFTSSLCMVTKSVRRVTVYFSQVISKQLNMSCACDVLVGEYCASVGQPAPDVITPELRKEAIQYIDANFKALRRQVANLESTKRPAEQAVADPRPLKHHKAEVVVAAEKKEEEDDEDAPILAPWQDNNPRAQRATVPSKSEVFGILVGLSIDPVVLQTAREKAMVISRQNAKLRAGRVRLTVSDCVIGVLEALPKAVKPLHVSKMAAYLAGVRLDRATGSRKQLMTLSVYQPLFAAKMIDPGAPSSPSAATSSAPAM